MIERQLSDCTSAEIMCLVGVADKRIATLESERIELLKLYDGAMMREIVEKNLNYDAQASGVSLTAGSGNRGLRVANYAI